MVDVLEYDGTTGKTVERPFTAEESAQREVDEAAAAEQAAAEQAAEAARVQAIQDAQAEAKAMGFSDGAVATITGYPYPYNV